MKSSFFDMFAMVFTFLVNSKFNFRFAKVTSV